MFHLRSLFCFWLAFLVFAADTNAKDSLPEVTIITSYYEPYSYQGKHTVEGIATTRVKRLLQHMGLKKEIRIYPWARAYSIAQSQPNTLIFSMARTPQREHEFHWVGEIVGFDVYLYRAQNRDDIQVSQLSDLKPYRIGALNKDVKGSYLAQHGITPITLSDEEAGIKLVHNGRLDLIPVDATAMKYRLGKMGIPPTDLVPAYRLSEISKPLYLAFSKHSDPFIVERFKKAYRELYGTHGID